MKMAGTVCTAVVCYHIIPHVYDKEHDRRPQHFMHFLYVWIFLVDCLYIYLVRSARRASGASLPDPHAEGSVVASTSAT
jgi:hypothetical protein